MTPSKILQIIFLLVMIQLLPNILLAQRGGSMNGCWTAFDGILNTLADSLNYVKDPSKLPKFLNDYILDWKFRNYLNTCLKDDSEKISFRKAVIDRVCREDALKWIISSKNQAYDKRYVPDQLKQELGNNPYNSFPILPSMNYSWRDLAKNRLEDMQERRRDFK